MGRNIRLLAHRLHTILNCQCTGQTNAYCWSLCKHAE